MGKCPFRSAKCNDRTADQPLFVALCYVNGVLQEGKIILSDDFIRNTGSIYGKNILLMRNVANRQPPLFFVGGNIFGSFHSLLD